MCTTETFPSSSETNGHASPQHIVISGAGPTGLLLCALLMHRNETKVNKHRITLFDGRQDYGRLSLEEMKNNRSWSVFLSVVGIDALKEIPGLYEEYMTFSIKMVQTSSVTIGSTKVVSSKAIEETEKTRYLVDRNMFVSWLSKFLHDKYGDAPELTMRYNTKVMYVDYENKKVQVRHDNQDEVLPYDLLAGCDGLRSVVRETFLKFHSDFTFDLSDIAERTKVLHLARPKHTDPEEFKILMKCIGNFYATVFPQLDGTIAYYFCQSEAQFKDTPEELLSNDPKVVADYFRENFKPYKIDDCDDIGRQWVAQRWRRVLEVHCSSYHSVETGSILLGDAAHATSPALGSGLNNGLRDAQVFVRLLDQHEDNFSLALPAYSNLRVKEGHALSNLSRHMVCQDPNVEATSAVCNLALRSFLHRLFPSWVTPHPRNALHDNPRMPLAEVYQIAKDIGLLQENRRINLELSQEALERRIGLSSVQSKNFDDKEGTPLGLNILLTKNLLTKKNQ